MNDQDVLPGPCGAPEKYFQTVETWDQNGIDHERIFFRPQNTRNVVGLHDRRVKVLAQVCFGDPIEGSG